MELFPPLTGFFKAIKEDVRIGTTHISLYMALLQEWNIKGGKNPIAIDRNLIMKSVKIGARHTYNKCMNDLHDYGYIIYTRSINAYSSSTVYLIIQ